MGTDGWDVSVMARYYYCDHPAYRASSGGYSDLQVVLGILAAYTGPDGMFPTDYDLVDQIIVTDFPHLSEEHLSEEPTRIAKGPIHNEAAKATKLRDRFKSHPFDSSIRAIGRGLARASPARLLCLRRDNSSINSANSSTSHSVYRWIRERARLTYVPKPIELELDPDLSEPGVTGVGFDLPLFDGQSTDPADHIIDLDTDSMERCADVRVHFWNVGQQVQSERAWYNDQPDAERPIDPALRVEYDDMLVKLGREYLKESMRKKEG